jgi:phage pi2 protein 07
MKQQLIGKDENTETLKKMMVGWGMQNCNRRDEESKINVVNKRKKGDWRAGVSPKKKTSTQNN